MKSHQFVLAVFFFFTSNRVQAITKKEQIFKEELISVLREVEPSILSNSPAKVFLATDSCPWNLEHEDDIISKAPLSRLPQITSTHIHFGGLQWNNKGDSNLNIYLRLIDVPFKTSQFLQKAQEMDLSFWKRWEFVFDGEEFMMKYNPDLSEESQIKFIPLFQSKAILKKYVRSRWRLFEQNRLLKGSCPVCKYSESIDGAVSIARRLIGGKKKDISWPVFTARRHKEYDASRWLRKINWRIFIGPGDQTVTRGHAYIDAKTGRLYIWNRSHDFLDKFGLSKSQKSSFESKGLGTILDPLNISKYPIPKRLIQNPYLDAIIDIKNVGPNEAVVVYHAKHPNSNSFSHRLTRIFRRG